MRLCTFEILASGLTRWGINYGNRVYAIADNLLDDSPPPSFYAALRRWDYWSGLIRALADEIADSPDAYAGHFVDAIRYLPPLPNPPTFRDFYAFEEHVKTARGHRDLTMPKEWYEFPVFYFSNPMSMIGQGSALVKPDYTEKLDYELEVACIIGRGGRDIAVSEAAKHIAGYTILNDWSARDVQRAEMKVGLGPAKGKDFATSLGPLVVTPDEIETKRKQKGYDLEMRALRNGHLLSRGNWASIFYSFEEMIARASQGVYLQAGDLLASGTVGTGCILELGPEKAGGWLKPGDLIRLEIDTLGYLENAIV
jgi:fumarylacetoacetate (FAA) hydrolase